MPLILSVETEDGTVLNDSLELISMSRDQGRKVHPTKGDVFLAFHLHYKPRRRFWCLHFQRRNSRVWGKARVTSGNYEDTKVFTVADVK